ncbi:methylated-DNA--[protein]-cysteine S-methyltransferase [Inhella gelatinilytica]|uniref:methylated-DNA--[protein]-cysteine S-methyltransferase n=1 Tax=Inhella gelatinilytica TaxID=2795030 RepID=A0A931NEX8_9BURK|nr:MGMT family protein [Inhella gelatinilytica]MBH9552966.1 MGMT family protein [Inhella gelatinilytica]
MTAPYFFNDPAPAIAQCEIQTSYGPTLLRRTRRGLSGIWHLDQLHFPAGTALAEEPQHPWFLQAQTCLLNWPALERDPALPPLDPQGTEFQRRVWALLLGIPRGSWTSYGALAQQLGDARKSRAVGAAVGRNPIGILIPCHRVLGSDQSLTGYAGGLPMKRSLLQQEGVAYREAAGCRTVVAPAGQLELLP